MEDIEVLQHYLKSFLGVMLVYIIVFTLTSCAGVPEDLPYSWPSGEHCEAAFDGTAVSID